jgi:two-component sensor histidine kinase/CheY-like chemotaxis protein
LVFRVAYYLGKGASAEVNEIILLVEDDTNEAAELRSILQEAHFSVVHASSGDHAIELYRTTTPSIDLVLVNIDLSPGFDGIETGKQILRHRPVPVVFITSGTKPHRLQEATDAITPYGFVERSSAGSVLPSCIHVALRLFHAGSHHGQAEEVRRLYEARYRILFENTTIEVHVWQTVRDEHGEIRTWRLVDINPAAVASWNRNREEIIGRTVDEIWPGADSLALFLPIVKKVFADQRAFTWESYFSPTNQVLLMTTVPLGEHFISTGMDISDRIRDEEEMRRQLQEKEALLKEMHHRVKNNLNVVASLLRLQEDSIDSVEAAHEAFEQSRNRILSMALVHESLYRSDNLAEVGLDRYIRGILEHLQQSTADDPQINYHCDLDPVLVGIDLAIPCGIIINELVTNAAKHAFPGTAPAEVAVVLHREGPKLLLSVRDNGIGISEDAMVGHNSKLGLNLVHILAEQISAPVTISSNQGTTVSLRIPIEQLAVDGDGHPPASISPPAQ